MYISVINNGGGGFVLIKVGRVYTGRPFIKYHAENQGMIYINL